MLLNCNSYYVYKSSETWLVFIDLGVIQYDKRFIYSRSAYNAV